MVWGFEYRDSLPTFRSRLGEALRDTEQISDVDREIEILARSGDAPYRLSQLASWRTAAFDAR
jgi:hypothetical protein